jgi:hypothetical protein
MEKDRFVIYDWQSCPKEGDVISFNEYMVVMREPTRAEKNVENTQEET